MAPTILRLQGEWGEGKREGDWSGWEGSRKMRQVGQGKEVRGGKDPCELAYKDENVMMKPITLC